MIMPMCKNMIFHSLRNPSPWQHVCRYPIASFHLFSTSSKKAQRQPKDPTLISKHLVEKHQFSSETASKAASAIALLKNPEKFDSVLSYLKGIGFSNTHLENFVTCAQYVLCASLEQTVKPKIEVFQDLGFSASDIADIISANPWVLMHSANYRIGPTLSVLKDVLGSVDAVSKVLKVSAWFFKYNVEKTLLPNIEYLKTCGIDSSQLVNHIYNFPRLLLNRPENVQKYVGKVDKFGFDKSSKLYLYAITAASSMSDMNWEHKFELFLSLGFTKHDIVFMFNKRPQIFAVSERKIREVVQTVLDTGKYAISVFVKHPGVFLASVEDRLKPRFKVLEVLEIKNLLKKRPGLSCVYVISDKEFINKFVRPNLKVLGPVSSRFKIEKSRGLTM